MDSILITKPIRTLHGVVHVPPPVVLVHVSKRSVDTTLSSHSVRTCGEELRDTGGLETSLGQTESGAQTSTTGADNDRIILMILWRKSDSHSPAAG